MSNWYFTLEEVLRPRPGGNTDGATAMKLRKLGLEFLFKLGRLLNDPQNRSPLYVPQPSVLLSISNLSRHRYSDSPYTQSTQSLRVVAKL